jgi:hypothetical protein
MTTFTQLPQIGRACRRPAALAVGSLLAAGCLLAGCGGSSPSSAAKSGGPTLAGMRGEFISFAACMRSHGLSAYPDPKFVSTPTGGGVQISPGGLNPNAPAFKGATVACHHLLPDGGAVGTSGPEAAVNRAQGVVFADCVRSHGLPTFPDPDRDSAFTLPPSINDQAPAFTRAVRACQKLEPNSFILNEARS